MTETKPFAFGNGEFDVSGEQRGDSFIVYAPGLARGLGFRDAPTMLRHVDDRCKGYVLARTPGGDQQVWYVTEGGFYRVVGQRLLSRIKDKGARAAVERFQSWVFDEVLPQIRRTGAYVALTDAGLRAPHTLNWDEAAALLRQRYALDFTAVDLTRACRSAGVLKQNGNPKADFRYLFWFTGSTFEIHPHALPIIAARLVKAQREIENSQITQTRLFGIEGGAAS